MGWERKFKFKRLDVVIGRMDRWREKLVERDVTDLSKEVVLRTRECWGLRACAHLSKAIYYCGKTK